MSKSSLEAAAEAAAKVNAMLIAKGKLKLSPSQPKPKINSNVLARGKNSGDLITAEVDINDAPLSARNLLTRGHMQDEICKASGAAISTRGRYMTPEERQSIATPECRPLYLNVQASTYEAVKIAVKKIQEVIDYHVHISGMQKCPTAGVVTYPAVTSNGSFGVTQMAQPSHIPSGAHYVQDKVFVGLEHATPEYPVREKILGPGGSFLQHIRTETGANVTLRGKGSGFIEPTSGREAFEPLYIHITHPKPEGLQAAKALAVNLVETAHVEYAQWQQSQQSYLQPLTSVVLPQNTSVAYQNQVVVTPTVLPVPGALPTATSVIASGYPTSVTPGTTLTSGIPSLMHANVQTLVPVSVVSSMPQGISSAAVITYPTYVASTNQMLARPATPVLARPAIPSVSLIGVLPTLQTATYAAAAIQQRSPYANAPHLTYTQQPVVSYAAVSAPQTNLNQASVSPTTLVMSGSDTANYAVAATRFPVLQPHAVHRETEDARNPRLYNGVEVNPRERAGENKSSCLQESNQTHPTEPKRRRGAAGRCHDDKDLMPPPPANLAFSASAIEKREVDKSSVDQEPEKKKIKGALGGLATIYGSDSDEEEDADTST